MLTQFGKALRAIRQRKNKSAKEFAEYLGVTTSYLSAIELGKRNVPVGMEKACVSFFDLNKAERAEIQEAIEKSQGKLTIDMKKFNERQKRIIWNIIDFNLTEEQTDEILQILEG